MSDVHDCFRAHAVAAALKARQLPRGRIRDKQRTVARVYHLLARKSVPGPDIQRLDDYRAARFANSSRSI
jgi:hypothetical protein